MSTSTLPNYENLRTKYLNMAKSMGVDATITALHNEVGTMESQIYDGGYQEARLELVQKLRELSREIWTAKFAL
jgi:hypothetical protein